MRRDAWNVTLTGAGPTADRLPFHDSGIWLPLATTDMSNRLEEEGAFCVCCEEDRESSIRGSRVRLLVPMMATTWTLRRGVTRQNTIRTGAEQASSSYGHASPGVARLSVCCQLLAISMAEICVSLKF